MPSADAIAAAYHPQPVTMPPPPAPPPPSLFDLQGLFKAPTSLGGIILNAVAPGYALTSNLSKQLAPVAQQQGGAVAALSNFSQAYNSAAEDIATQIIPAKLSVVASVLPISQEPTPAPPPITANVET